MNCVWELIEKNEKGNVIFCKFCGFKFTDMQGMFPDRIYRECPEQNPQLALGNMVASGLEAIGVTQELAKKLFGDCRCNERIAWLNRFNFNLRRYRASDF